MEWRHIIQAEVRVKHDPIRSLQAGIAEIWTLEHEQDRLRALGINLQAESAGFESNGLGYDAESYDSGPYGPVVRLIEVKSSQSVPPRVTATASGAMNAGVILITQTLVFEEGTHLSGAPVSAEGHSIQFAYEDVTIGSKERRQELARWVSDLFNNSCPEASLKTFFGERDRVTPPGHSLAAACIRAGETTTIPGADHDSTPESPLLWTAVAMQSLTLVAPPALLLPPLQKTLRR